MNSTIIEVKKQEVEVVTEKFNNSISCVVIDSRGLTVKEVTKLRKQLLAEGIELKVIKNNISKRAAKDAGYAELSEVFAGPSAIAFSKSDAVAPAKIIYNFAKTHEKLEVKGGYIERKVVSVEQLSEVAKLPNRDGMLSMLLSVLQAPIRNFAYAVQSIADKNSEATSETNE
jgi:large subunit ribosomal protein L10